MTGRMKRMTAAVLAAFLLTGPVYADEVISSGDLRFQITVPDGWEDMAGTLTAGDADKAFLIRCGSAADASYLVFGCEEKDAGALESFEDYQSLLVEGVTGNGLFSDVEISPSLDITLRGTGLRGKLTTFSALFHREKGADLRVAGRLYALEGVREYYQFFAWTKEENAPAQNMVADRIVNSLRILI